jgi:primary-amine oxidase
MLVSDHGTGTNAINDTSLEFPPHYNKTPNGHTLPVATTAPPAGLGTVEEAFSAAKRERIPPPLRPYDFLPDLMAKTEEGGYKPREGLKPLHISQPEGVSFKLDGHVLEWQGWKMHVGETPAGCVQS